MNALNLQPATGPYGYNYFSVFVILTGIPDCLVQVIILLKSHALRKYQVTQKIGVTKPDVRDAPKDIQVPSVTLVISVFYPSGSYHHQYIRFDNQFRDHNKNTLGAHHRNANSEEGLHRAHRSSSPNSHIEILSHLLAAIEQTENMDITFYTKHLPIIIKGIYTTLQVLVEVEIPEAILVVTDTKLIPHWKTLWSSWYTQ